MTLPEAWRDAPAGALGDTPELADALLALVLAGRKTAACGARAQFGPGELPEVGRIEVLLDGRGRPAAVIETTEVRLCRFDEVDAGFAFAEGEGDGSLAAWRRDHEAYFRRTGGFAPDMAVVCERFRLVAALPRD